MLREALKRLSSLFLFSLKREFGEDLNFPILVILSILLFILIVMFVSFICFIVNLLF